MDPRGQPLRHMEQLLLVTSCDSPVGIGASHRTHAQWTDGWTHRRDVGNSILDMRNQPLHMNFQIFI